MHNMTLTMRMRMTLIIADALLEKARKLSGLAENTAVVRAGLEALIGHASARRLAVLGGSVCALKSIPRRRGRTAG